MINSDRIKNESDARDAMLAYQNKPSPEAVKRLVGDLDQEGDSIFGPILINMAYLFANKSLANNFSLSGTLDPKSLGQIHKWAPAGSLKRFDKRIIDRAKFEELKIDMSIKLLKEIERCKLGEIRNPFGWVWKTLHNFGCDLANKEKCDYKAVPPKRIRWQKSGDEQEDIIERAAAPDCWEPAPAQLPEAPERPPEISELSLTKLEALYRRAFSEHFRASVESSLIEMREFLGIVHPEIFHAHLEYLEKNNKLAKIPTLNDPARVATRRKLHNRLKQIREASEAAEAVWAKKGYIGKLKRRALGSLLERLNLQTRAIAGEIPIGAERELDYLRRLSPQLFSPRASGGPWFLGKVFELSVSPPRIMRDVWIRSKEIKRREDGCQNSRHKLSLVFWYQKRSAEGTLWEPLFRTINKDADLENLRKYQYRQPRKAGHSAAYRWLVNSIYKRSFIEQPAA